MSSGKTFEMKYIYIFRESGFFNLRGRRRCHYEDVSKVIVLLCGRKHLKRKLLVQADYLYMSLNMSAGYFGRLTTYELEQTVMTVCLQK